MAPRSRSSSESSHDSESPRKRAPSCSDAEGETDAPGSSPATTTTNNNGLLLFYSSAAANEPPRVTPGCVHIGALLGSTTLVHNYEKAVRWAARSRGGSSSNSSRGPPRKRRKTQSPTCRLCHSSLYRPNVCLDCQFVGCKVEGHINQHATQTEHGFWVEALSGTVFCVACANFIHDASLEGIRENVLLKIEEEEGAHENDTPRRVPYKPWMASKAEGAVLQKTPTAPCTARRGLLNLGATCYLNVILQSFLHNPLLRAYYLSDKHNWRACDKTGCMSCELDKLFTDVYSPSLSTNNSPGASQQSNLSTGTTVSNNNGKALGPVSILRTTWENSMDMAGYAQQDAHEFFISVLNQVHASTPGSTNGPSCSCIVHQAFSGQLQSDVKCGKCGFVNPTVDPMMDISLELKSIQGAPGVTSLASCLRRFTQAETLPPKAYSCEQCKTATHEATKRLSIKKLPPVLCIQLKRFEHKAAGQKIDAPIRFPSTLNMAPYTTHSIGMEEHARKASRSGPPLVYPYDLFSVVNHDGLLNTGHYTNFSRSHDEWYRFDDDKVTKAKLSDCLASTPYMCFYVRRQLEYKPSLPRLSTTKSPPDIRPLINVPAS